MGEPYEMLGGAGSVGAPLQPWPGGMRPLQLLYWEELDTVTVPKEWGELRDTERQLASHWPRALNLT